MKKLLMLAIMMTLALTASAKSKFVTMENAAIAPGITAVADVQQRPHRRPGVRGTRGYRRGPAARPYRPAPRYHRPGPPPPRYYGRRPYGPRYHRPGPRPYRRPGPRPYRRGPRRY